MTATPYAALIEVADLIGPLPGPSTRFAEALQHPSGAPRMRVPR